MCRNDYNNQLERLSLISTEEGKIASARVNPPTHSVMQPPAIAKMDQPPSPHEKPILENHLKASTFSDTILPVDLLSQPVQDYIKTVAMSYGCHNDYVVTTCLITAGIAAGKRVQLLTNPYTNYSCDFICLVGRPGTNKTGLIKEITKPLHDYDKDNYTKYYKAKVAYSQSKERWGNFSEKQTLFHQLVVGDSSPEARNELLAQGDMIVIIADEMRAFIDSFGRYTKGGNGSAVEISQLLSIWSNDSFSINRKSEDTKFIETAAMSIIGGMQPELIAETFGIKSLMFSGFTQRFLFVYPDKVKFIKRQHRERMTQEKRECWRFVIGRLFNIDPLTLQLSKEAERLYTDYADSNDMRADAEADVYVAGMKQKMNIHVLRLAIMAHLLSDHWNEPVITGEGMEYAIRIANYFSRVHVERIYPLLTGNGKQVPKKLTKELVIAEIGQTFDIQNKSALADALGYDRAKLTNILNGKLRK